MAASDPRKIAREENDFYRTPTHCTEALLKVENFGLQVWEPACGDGAISQVLEAAGHVVINTDLVDRRYGEFGRDFLREIVMPVGTYSIITNPPYKLADDFVLHALALGANKVAMLLRLSWLEGERRRRKVFVDHPPSRVWVFSGRPTLWHGTDPNPRDTGGAIAYAWFIWDRAAPTGQPTIGWLPAKPRKPKATT